MADMAVIVKVRSDRVCRDGDPRLCIPSPANRDKNRGSRRTTLVEMGTYTVAQVGAFQPMSRDDTYRWIVSVHWLVKHVEGFGDEGWGTPEDDIINMIDKRDFLTENKKYDIVVLHSIFHPEMYGMPISMWDTMMYGVSPHHSASAWRKRLAETEAKYIFVHSTLARSLSGHHLMGIEGYEAVGEEPKLTVYGRKAGIP